MTKFQAPDSDGKILEKLRLYKGNKINDKGRFYEFFFSKSPEDMKTIYVFVFVDYELEKPEKKREPYVIVEHRKAFGPVAKQNLKFTVPFEPGGLAEGIRGLIMILKDHPCKREICEIYKTLAGCSEDEIFDENHDLGKVMGKLVEDF